MECCIIKRLVSSAGLFAVLIWTREILRLVGKGNHGSCVQAFYLGFQMKGSVIYLGEKLKTCMTKKGDNHLFISMTPILNEQSSFFVGTPLKNSAMLLWFFFSLQALYTWLSSLRPPFHPS
jgi:hypothetical protein